MILKWNFEGLKISIAICFDCVHSEEKNDETSRTD